MMHKCSSSNRMGQCTCGLFHTQTNSFAMLFSMPNSHHHHETDIYPFPSSSSSSSSASVDCTLSLGTPSTRLCEDYNNHDDKRSFSSSSSNFCWDILQTKNTPTQTHKSTRGGATNSTTDPLLARRCANCDTTSTPLWRNGPRGPKSLCNACGIRFKKEERRATAANGSSSGSSSTSGTMTMEQQYYGYHHQNNNNTPTWVQTAQKMPCFSPAAAAAAANEFRFIEESDRDSDSSGIPFLSWRLNVTDRPSLVHDFTR